MKEKRVEERISDSTGHWQAPFDADSSSKAKKAVFERIGTIDREQTPVVSIRSRSEFDTAVQRMKIVKIAATIALLVGLSTVFWLLGIKIVGNDGNSYTAYTFKDGSTAQLSPDSYIAFNDWFWFVRRKVRLQGEAYFDVEAGNTFRVQTEVGNVDVLGTSFSVWATGATLMVHCSEGKVRVELEGDKIELNQYELTRKKSDKSLSDKQSYRENGPVFPSAYGVKTYQDAPLNLILAEIECASRIPLYSLLEDTLRYSGTLDLGNTDACVEAVCQWYNAKYAYDAKGYVMITP